MQKTYRKIRHYNNKDNKASTQHKIRWTNTPKILKSIPIHSTTETVKSRKKRTNNKNVQRIRFP